MARTVPSGGDSDGTTQDAEHTVTLEDRARMVVRGVEHVDSFNNERIILVTGSGRLVVTGTDLSIRELNLEKGIFAVTGRIDSMEYREEVAAGDKARGLLDRMFR